MNIKLEKLLQQIGFSKNEAKIYLASLELGLTSAQEIALKAGLPRTSAYSILKALNKKGYVAKSIIKGKLKFLSLPPEKLKDKVKEINKNLENSMPELKAIFNEDKNKPKILFYEGREAMQKVYDDTLGEKPNEILEWNTNDYFDFSKFDVDPKYIEKRIELGIKARRIAGKGSKWQYKHKKRDKEELSETLIVPKEKFWPHIEVNIYNNKVAFLNYEEQTSLIIESKSVAEAMRQAYELSWIGAKRIEV